MMSDLISMNENISRKAILRELERIAEIHPYKVIGDRDSYSPYNEAWEDCISLIEERLQFLPSAEPERIAKVVEHEMIITDSDGCSYHRTKYICGNCKKKVIGGDEYCSHCGTRLEWE